MKKDIVMYKNGSIVDFQGITHPFIVCALSTSSFQTEDISVALTTYEREDWSDLGFYEFPRAVFIGVAICNPGNGTEEKPGDVWDENKGKMIALAKARGFKYDNPEKSAALFATRAGLISEKLVEALLDREVEHIQEDPESVIKGYNQMKARWEEKQEQIKFMENVTPEVKELGNKLAELPADKIMDVINVALIKSNE